MYYPENEESLSDRLPEETPVEEIPAEEIPAEEVPAEEVPAEEVPAEEVPEELLSMEEVPAEDVAVPALPGKKKIWIWIVIASGVLLVAAILAACIFGINPYFARKNAYEKAVSYLEQRDFDSAREQFLAAGAYEDAAVYYADLTAKENLYQTAKADLEKGDHAQAKEGFAALADYKDAHKLAQDCLYQMAVGYLSEQEPEKAFALRAEMDEDTYQRFASSYLSNFADQKALSAIENSLQLRYEKEQAGATAYEAVKAEQDALAAMEELPAYADTALEQLVKEYRDGVALQFAACKEEGGFENHDFYTGGHARAAAIEKLMASYSLLKDNEALTQAHTGKEAQQKAYLDMQIALENDLFDKQEKKGANGKTYQPFENTAKVAAVVRFTQSFYRSGKHLGGNESILYVLPGETVYIPADKWSKTYDERIFTWEILEVHYGEELTLKPGVYKLQSLVKEELFYDLQTLAKEDITPDTVQVTFRDNGTGTWLEAGETTKIAYTDTKIAVEGTDQRLGYLAAPGKIVVYVEQGYYVLTMDDAQ